MFTAPNDPAKLAEWERKIKRADRKLTPSAVVCEKHFEDICIERSFKVTVNGVVNEIIREKPSLKPDAVPTVFENYPPHLVPTTAPKRKEINLCDQQPARKRHKRDAGTGRGQRGKEINESSCSLEEGFQDSDDCSGSSEAGIVEDSATLPTSNHHENRHPFQDILIPVTWMRIPTVGDSLAYAYCEAQENNFSNLFLERMVRFGKPSADEGLVVATVYLRGREEGNKAVSTRNEAESLIADVNKTYLCGGCGMKPTSTKHTSYRDMYVAERCLLTTPSKGESCVHCKYQRKLAQNQVRRTRKKSTCSEKKKSKNITRNLARTRRRLTRAQAQISQMKERNEALSQQEFEKRIQALPRKQQLAVKNCFLAARRKSTRGMKYDDEWISSSTFR